MLGRGRGRAIGLVVVALVVLACSACVGDTPRAEFDRTLRQRSSGLPASLAFRAIDALGDELGTTELSVRTLVADGPGRTVTVDVIDPDDPEALLRYVYADGALGDPQAIDITTYGPLAADAFRTDQVPALRDLGPLVDATLEALHLGDAGVDGLTVERPDRGEVRLVLRASSTDEGSGEATFDAEGALVEAHRS